MLIFATAFIPNRNYYNYEEDDNNTCFDAFGGCCSCGGDAV